LCREAADVYRSFGRRFKCDGCPAELGGDIDVGEEAFARGWLVELTYAEDDYKILCPACAQQMRAYAGRQSRSDPGTKPSEAPRKPKGAFKFTLRDLFWLVLLVACLCGWWLQYASMQRRLAALEAKCQELQQWERLLGQLPHKRSKQLNP
jgi:hypothetical protein